MTQPIETSHATSPFHGVTEWDVALYLKFEKERVRAATDLLARTPTRAPRRIVDLGCGPGASTHLLSTRFPEADVIGIDSSERMLASARMRLPMLRFEKRDIDAWTPAVAPDLIFANSSLQWLPDHHELIPRLFSFLAPGGALAIQMPDNRQEPSHALMRMVAADGPWVDRLLPIAKTRAVIGAYSDYYRWLRPLGAKLDIWQTTYIHALNGVGELVDWFRGSGLRPFLNPLDECEREDFIARYMEELAAAYPSEPDGRVLFLYPRLFVIAAKADL
ncbi:MAG TPA: trans-aconitate 2-methyltransferase [Roseiarcus sp.]|nr:trans-aconitate 2-methyltransferase [Roseiarcus sp.]